MRTKNKNKVDIEKFLDICDEIKGERSWRELVRNANFAWSSFCYIRRGDMAPSVDFIIKLALYCNADKEKAGYYLKQLLDAAGYSELVPYIKAKGG